MISRHPLLLAPIFFLALLAARPAQALFTLTVDGDQLVAEDATPGGEVAFVGAGREIRDTVPYVRRACDLVTAGPDEVATLELSQTSPDNSIWLAFDLASGSVAVATTSTERVASLFPPANLDKNAGGAVTGLQVELAGFYQLLVARPDGGAWCDQATDGGERDNDLLQDGSLSFLMENMVNVGGTTNRLGDLQAGDLLVMIDSETLEIAYVVLSAAQIAAGRTSL